MSALREALVKKYGTPEAALRALGLDASLLSDRTEEIMRLPRKTYTAMAAALKATGKMAMDADIEAVADLLERIEGVEGDRGRVRDVEPNAGLPPWLEEHKEDADDEFESEEERREDEEADDRRRGLDRRLGHRASDEEGLREEEEMEFRRDTANALDVRRAEDRKRIRADDARKRLGRDETPEECEAREKEEEAEDRRHARDRARKAMDYRRARDAHRSALDKMRRHADDWRKHSEDKKRADDAHRSAEDAKNADDAKRHADDRKRAEDRQNRTSDDSRKAYDEVCSARDARRHARDARRMGRDNPPPFKGMPEPGGTMVTKEAMDAAIERRIAENDAKHRGIASALEAVRPKVGSIAMDSAIQSEADVYGRALDVLAVPHAGITQLAALKQMFAMAPRPGEREARYTMATDARPAPAVHDQFREMFGDQAANIQRA